MPDIEKIKTLFSQAIALPGGQDPGVWLKTQCADDSALLEEVQSLLDAYSEVERRSAETPKTLPAIPDAQFGPYRAVQLLGCGGTSAVYRAERVDGKFQQTVALKVMAAFLNSPEFLLRFDTERQLLASLNHPHIAHLLDGGTSTSGNPYLAMEYVEGERLDAYCDRNRLDIDARLRLFLQVCDAVDYVHRQLIVHRDLKPNNMLVTVEGKVKLLDFGTGALLPSQSDTTVTRTRMMTPRYASPERLRGERASVADDVFSLGVVLFELLTGAWPFGDPGSALREFERAVSDSAAALPASVVTAEAAEARGFRLRALQKQLAGDLSAILLKALEPDRERRYASVRDLATDASCYLRGLPVNARRPTFRYRAGKFLRRHWLPLAAITSFMIALLAAAGAALYQARAAGRYAAHERAVSEFAKDTFLSASPTIASPLRGQSRPIQFADILDNAAKRVGEELAADPIAESDIRGTIGTTYAILGDPAKGQAQILRAIERLRQTGNDRSSIAADLQVRLCNTQSYQGHWVEALVACRQAVALAREYGSTEPLAGILHDTAYMIVKCGAPLEEAEAVFRDGLTYSAAPSAMARSLPPIINTRIGSLRLQRGDLDGGESLLDAAERQLRAKPGPPIEIIPTLLALSFGARVRDNFGEAARLLREAAAMLQQRPTPYYSADQIVMELAADAALAGEPGMDDKLHQVEDRVRAGPQSPVDEIRFDLLAGIVEARTASPARAEQLFRSALSLAVKDTPRQPSNQVEVCLRLAELLKGAGRSGEAAGIGRQGLEAARLAYGEHFEQHPWTRELRGFVQ